MLILLLTHSPKYRKLKKLMTFFTPLWGYWARRKRSLSKSNKTIQSGVKTGSTYIIIFKLIAPTDGINRRPLRVSTNHFLSFQIYRASASDIGLLGNIYPGPEVGPGSGSAYRNMGCGSRPAPCSGVSELALVTPRRTPCNGLAASTAG